MRIGNLIKTAVKFAPIIIPIVKKVMDSRKSSTQQLHIHANKKLELINLSSNFFYMMGFISVNANKFFIQIRMKAKLQIHLPLLMPLVVA